MWALGFEDSLAHGRFTNSNYIMGVPWALYVESCGPRVGHAPVVITWKGVKVSDMWKDTWLPGPVPQPAA